MGHIQASPLVRPIAGLLAADAAWLAEGREALEVFLGPIAAASQPIPFTHSAYYEQEMGSGLLRQFIILAGLRPAEELADWKQKTNELEAALGQTAAGGRRLNIDPGYLAPGKLILASTKNHEQRIYLRSGIYAEMTLRIRDGRFTPWPWTYPDYAEARDFFDQAYHAYLEQIKRT
jgi:hypothetical protein